MLLVSHDRKFLDNVVNSTLVFEGNGVIQEYVGGYEDWLRQKPSSTPLVPKTSSTPVKIEKAKLSSAEREELKRIPKKIEKLETEIVQLQEKMADPDFYGQDQEEITKILNKFKRLNEELETTYQRWEALEK